MNIAEEEKLFISEIKSLARELSININMANSFWREGKYTKEEKNEEINKIYKRFLEEIAKLKDKYILIAPHHCPKCGDEVAGNEDGLCERCV